ncbi:MAG: methyltransferase domain-containing protein [Ruminococcaceae bacterium]|nr:methyltransferase domain-containing protein [Oscillospiraceae bacterium]
MEDLKLEVISPTLSVYQKKGVFCYGTDAVLLAKYVLNNFKSMKNMKMCDLCSGTGIIPLFICDNNKDINAVGVEINKEACEIAVMSASVSGLSNRYSQIYADIKEVKNYFEPESFNFITCNPPYMTVNSGYMCDADYKTIARHEILCNIDDVFKAAFYLLRTGGNLFIVYRSDRLSSLFKAAHNNRFEIKDMVCISSENLPSNCKLILCKASKDASEGLSMKISSVNIFS